MNNNLSATSFKDKLDVMRSLSFVQENVSNIKKDNAGQDKLCSEKNTSSIETLSFVSYHNSAQPIKLKKR